MIEGFDSRVNDRMGMFEPLLARATGAVAALMRDACYDYCRICVQLDDVTDKVLETGTTIQNVQGNLVKNPDMTTMHQLANEKNALLPKLLKNFKELDDSEETADVIKWMAGE